jgi:hypothetical protein
MAMCVPSNIERFNEALERDPLKCGICYETFTREDYKKLNIWTHVGGENHDPMHKSCLKAWVQSRINSGNQPRCPFDFCVLDVSPLTSMAERVFQNLKPCLVDGAFAAVTGLLAGAAGLMVTGSAPLMAGATTAAAVGVAGLAPLMAGATVAAAVGVAGVALGAAAALGVAGVAGEAVQAAVAIGLAGAGGVVTGSVVKSLFNRIVGSEEIRTNAVNGLLIGSFTPYFLMPLNLLSGYPTTLLTISLVSGVAAGCITAYRRFVAH